MVKRKNRPVPFLCIITQNAKIDKERGRVNCGKRRPFANFSRKLHIRRTLAPAVYGKHKGRKPPLPYKKEGAKTAAPQGGGCRSAIKSDLFFVLNQIKVIRARPERRLLRAFGGKRRQGFCTSQEYTLLSRKKRRKRADTFQLRKTAPPVQRKDMPQTHPPFNFARLHPY